MAATDEEIGAFFGPQRPHHLPQKFAEIMECGRPKPDFTTGIIEDFDC
jgi:hypothetical protein